MANKKYLGKLCRRRHEHEKTGKSLRYTTGHCIKCVRNAYLKRMENPFKKIHALSVARLWYAKNRETRRKECKIYQFKNKAKIEARRRERYFANHTLNLSKIKAYRELKRDSIRLINREYRRRQRKTHPDKVKLYASQYYAKNHIKMKLRHRISKAIRQQKTKKIFTIAGYGINIQSIMAYIGNCPGNLKEWEIDHIRPLSSFDMSNPSQVREAFKPENHQWLTKQENRTKASKYVQISIKN